MSYQPKTHDELREEAQELARRIAEDRRFREPDSFWESHLGCSNPTEERLAIERARAVDEVPSNSSSVEMTPKGANVASKTPVEKV